MGDKPAFQEDVQPPIVSLTAASGVKPPKSAATAMRHRTFSGRINYLDGDGAETGREWFTVTVQPDGVRTMRAMCEMDEYRLLRDCTITVNPSWQPIDAFLRVSIQEKVVGSSWFYFDEDSATCEGHTANEGRLSQYFKLPERAQRFGTHPLTGDAWEVVRFRHQRANGGALSTAPRFSSSLLSNGGSGPLLTPSRSPERGPAHFAQAEFIGYEQTTTQMGVFNTEHIKTTFGPGDEMDTWAMGEDALPCYQTHIFPDRPKWVFELVSLEGDYR